MQLNSIYFNSDGKILLQMRIYGPAKNLSWSFFAKKLTDEWKSLTIVNDAKIAK